MDSKFKFKPEVEQDIIINHPDLTGDAEHIFKERKRIFDAKYEKQIITSIFMQYIKFNELQKKKRRNMNETCEQFVNGLNISKENWLNEDEESAVFVSHYVEQIRLEVEKQERCQQWVKDYFF